MSLIGFRRSVVVLVVVMAMLVDFSESKCAFEAIFNFGDSNTDTGGFSAAFPAAPAPNGMTYFKQPAGRVSDGRQIIDFLAALDNKFPFLRAFVSSSKCQTPSVTYYGGVDCSCDAAQALGLPFLSPYLQSIGSDYTHGANFATEGSTAIQPTTSLFDSGVSPFSLGIQLNQMKHFKSLVDALSSSKGPTNLPPPDIFGKSLYTLYIGQNDFTGTFESAGVGAVQQQNPQVINQITTTIKELYGIGGRTFMVLNLAPVGCYPAALVRVPHGNSDLDQSGCIISYNNAVVEYNKMLKDALSQMKQQLPDANVIHVDTHAVLLELFQNPSSHGLKYGTRACCGAGGGAYNYYPQVFRGSSKDINGTTITASACSEPNNYASWDGVHTTEAANNIVTNAILSGSYFDPFFDLHNFCDIQPIG